MPPFNWTLGSTYQQGDVVVYQGRHYVCLQGHRADAPDWTPDSVPALFSAITEGRQKSTDTAAATPPPAERSCSEWSPPLCSEPSSGSIEKRLLGKRLVVGYYQTWSAPWAGAGAMHELAKLTSTYNVVCLAFTKPDTNYVRGSFADTGLQFNSDFAVVRDAIAILKQSSIVVLLSVGGATYHGWENLNVESLRTLVDDLGVDGIDIDCEDQTMRHELGSITNLRNAFPRPHYILTLAAFSVGAYGHGDYQDAPPASPSTGMCVPGLQQAGTMLDAILGMFYDAGNEFDPCVAFDAYRQLFRHGPIAIGIEVPPEAWGGHVVTIRELETYARYVMQRDPDGLSGLMVWSHHKQGSPPTTEVASAAVVVDVARRLFQE